jgi:hypothetical protein
VGAVAKALVKSRGKAPAQIANGLRTRFEAIPKPVLHLSLGCAVKMNLEICSTSSLEGLSGAEGAQGEAAMQARGPFGT